MRQMHYTTIWEPAMMKQNETEAHQEPNIAMVGLHVELGGAGGATPSNMGLGKQR
jgi:hypothetical protein